MTRFILADLLICGYGVACYVGGFLIGKRRRRDMDSMRRHEIFVNALRRTR